jgi:hypothetical protein
MNAGAWIGVAAIIVPVLIGGLVCLIKLTYAVGGIVTELKGIKETIKDMEGKIGRRLDGHDERLSDHDVKLARLGAEVEA